MAFDGGFLYKITNELKSAVDCHIDKIYQPSKDELVFLLRKKGFAKRMIISSKSGAARIHFTDQKYENPETPPMFCMLLRKYFSSARLTDVVQNGLERVLELVFAATDEMGDRVNLRIICELIGGRSNIILVNGEGRIIDSVRRSDIENGGRMIQPGAKYVYPQKQEKQNPLSADIGTLCDKILEHGSIPIAKAILETVDGFSPLVCRECALIAGDIDMLAADCPRSCLENALGEIIGSLKSEGLPTMLIKQDGTPMDFAYTDILQYGESVSKRSFADYSSLLDEFYASRENAARIHHAALDIIKLVNNVKARTEKKLALRLNELEKCKDREQLRIYGELLKANLYSLKGGLSFAEVQNYYDENLSYVRIPLNPALSPAANAAKYFKDYKKSYTAEQTLTRLTEKDREELIYLDSVLDSISRCETLASLSEIKDELTDGGYIRRKVGTKRKNSTAGGLLEFVSQEGYKIAVGKNNRQNDYITTKLASKNDLWFHVKNIPGSHVVVFCAGGDVSDNTIMQAARLAALHSKAAGSTQIPVDYTPVKYVKKPNGAKPGMVIYTTNKTVYVSC